MKYCMWLESERSGLHRKDFVLIRLHDTRFGPDKTTSCSCNGLHCLIHIFPKTFAENDPNLASELPHSITLLASRGNGTSVPTRHVSLQSIDTKKSRYDIIYSAIIQYLMLIFRILNE